jgi:hypothetical protein
MNELHVGIMEVQTAFIQNTVTAKDDSVSQPTFFYHQERVTTSQLILNTLPFFSKETSCSSHYTLRYDIVTYHLSTQPIQRFVARQQLRKYATVLQALLGSRSRVTMEIQLEEVFSMWSAPRLYHASDSSISVQYSDSSEGVVQISEFQIRRQFYV